MANQPSNGNNLLETVRTAVEIHGDNREELIPILNDINRTLGYLPKEALEEVSRLVKVPKSQLFAVTTFYKMLSTQQRGRHVIQFCESAP
ncbi:MAG: NAD(P)H-dependent oxidoreductase subunit E, partial [Anaerolineaceae bacterium]|nr:NAD(P)H-dependent oxidoreductase subunit E [Anaerolineaceae bacterium]